MVAFKNAAVYSTVAILCWMHAVAAYAQDFCPDYATDACLKAIRQQIERLDYEGARDDAELQCYETPDGGPSVELSEPVLLAQASGCYFLYSLEKFLDNSMKAVEAQERTRQIAAWSCNHGFDSLCEVSLGLIRLQFAALMGEVRGDLKHQATAKLLSGVALREIAGGRALPKSFLDAASQDLRDAFAAEGLPLKPCQDCRIPAKGRAAMTAGDAKKVLDVDMTLKGSELKLQLRVFDIGQARIVWERTYQTHDLTEKQRLFGFNAQVPPTVAEAKRLSDYEPNYKFLVGLGAARIPNVSGRAADSSRGVLQVRALERFHSGHSEVGMMLSLHATQRTLDKRMGRLETNEEAEDDENDEADDPAATPEDEEAALPPYPTAFGIYFVYGHMFYSGRENYDSIRHGLTVGAGGVMTNSILAGTYRVGWDLYFARRYVLSPAFVYFGASSIEVGNNLVKAKPTSGGELVLSLNL